MDDREARRIIGSLARGVHPFTGEILGDGLLQDARVVRALFLAEQSLAGTVERQRDSGRKARKLTLEERRQRNLAEGRPRNAGLPWTEEEKDRVVALHAEGWSPDALAQEFERTRGSIVAVLVNRGIIGAEEGWPAREANDREAVAARQPA